MDPTSKIVLIGVLVLLGAGASAYAWEMRISGNEVIPAADRYVPGNLLIGTDSSKKLGIYLIGFNGMTLYTYTKDDTNMSNCTGDCARTWIPYLAPYKDSLRNIEGGVPGKISTAARVGNTEQVTYEGRPLYFYRGDTASGEATGQGKDGNWSIVSVPALSR